MTKWQHPDSCNRCGEDAEIVSGNDIECETKCKVCGFEDYWGVGLFYSNQYGLDKAKRYWWDKNRKFHSEKEND